MQAGRNILSIVPYRILPATTGGQLGIVLLHNALGKLRPDHVASTTDNIKNDQYSFTLYRLFSDKAERYIPFNHIKRLRRLIDAMNINTIYCDHPYMMPTALYLSKKLWIPLYMRSHNIESERFKTLGKKWWRIMFWFEGRMMRKAKGIFFVTGEDADWAVAHYHLLQRKCHIIPFGTELRVPPEKNTIAKQELSKELSIPADRPWLYFVGLLDYYPNIQAVEFILNEVMPRLNAKGQNYQVLIAGKGLPASLELKIAQTPNIRYIGFVPDLNTFINACDVMLNPVLLGGGIKTKAVEALGYNKMVVSTHSGAAGLIREACGTNLLVTEDNDWDGFTEKIIAAINTTPNIPKQFYETYNWDHIARKVLTIMEQDAAQIPSRQKQIVSD